MDEIDSIGSARSESGGGGGGDSEVQRTMLELLNQLDGFEATNKIKACRLQQHQSLCVLTATQVLQLPVWHVQWHTLVRATSLPAYTF